MALKALPLFRPMTCRTIFRFNSSLRGYKGDPERVLSGTPRNPTKSVIESPVEISRGFDQFDLHPRVLQSVLLAGIHVPTSCQVYGIPSLMSGENLLLISQTGKGKTLAYMIPIVNKLLTSDIDKRHPSPNKPRAVVVLPTRELVEQALAVSRKILGSCVSTIGLAPGMLSFVKERRILNSTGADIIFTTPSRIELHLEKTPLSLSCLEFLVVDEADTLCDSVYEQSVSALIRLSRKHSKDPQIAIVGATKTAAVNAFVASIARKFSPVVTQDAHTLVPGLDQEFVTVGRRKRTSCLSEILGSEKLLPESKILVFTNAVRTCNFVSRFLEESKIEGIKAAGFHGQIPSRQRSRNYKNFVSNDTNVLVCTNLASRGIDLDNVTHVVMYDFPQTLADYIHRAGRTARAGRLGKVTALVTKRNLPLVQQIQQAVKFGKPIEHKKGPPPSRKSVKVDRYKSVLEEFRRSVSGKKPVGMTIRGLRAKMGLSPHDGIGSVGKRAAAKEVKSAKREEKELAFLKKRKRVGKKQNVIPKLPDRRVRVSETGSTTRASGLSRSSTGDLQFLNTS